MGVIDLDATVEGGPIAVKFNVTFLIEALSVMGSEQVVVELSSPTAPVAFRPEGVEGFTHIIMPMTEHRK
jgi:DNA polymerase-3 subunit beta